LAQLMEMKRPSARVVNRSAKILLLCNLTNIQNLYAASRKEDIVIQN
jgi:hypothetical protein